MLNDQCHYVQKNHEEICFSDKKNDKINFIDEIFSAKDSTEVLDPEEQFFINSFIYPDDIFSQNNNNEGFISDNNSETFSDDFQEPEIKKNTKNTATQYKKNILQRKK